MVPLFPDAQPHSHLPGFNPWGLQDKQRGEHQDSLPWKPTPGAACVSVLTYVSLLTHELQGTADPTEHVSYSVQKNNTNICLEIISITEVWKGRGSLLVCTAWQVGLFVSLTESNLILPVSWCLWSVNNMLWTIHPQHTFFRAHVESSLYTLGLHLVLECTGSAEKTPWDGHSPFHYPEGKGAR